MNEKHSETRIERTIRNVMRVLKNVPSKNINGDGFTRNETSQTQFFVLNVSKSLKLATQKMFKKLKDKIAEEVKSSPSRIQQFAQAAQVGYC